MWRVMRDMDSKMTSIFFILVIIVANWCLLNMVLGVIIEATSARECAKITALRIRASLRSTIHKKCDMMRRQAFERWCWVVIFFFSVVGMQIWGGRFHERCFIELPLRQPLAVGASRPNATEWVLRSDEDDELCFNGDAGAFAGVLAFE